MNKVIAVLAAVVCLLSGINAQTVVNNQAYATNAALGGYTALTAGAYVINYVNAGVAGAQLTITVSAPCTIALYAYLGTTLATNLNVNSGMALPTSALSVDLGAGYTLAISAGTATNIQLITSTATAAFTALLITNTNAGVVKVDTNNQVTATIPATYSSTTSKLTINLPDVGSYAVIAAKTTVPLPTATTAGAYYANANVTFDYGNSVQIQFFSSNSNAAVSQSFSSTYTQGSAAAAAWAPSLGAYVTVTIGTATSYTGRLRYTYTDAQLQAKSITDASKLKWAVYNAATASWTVPATGGSVDTSTKVVSQTTATFSEWGIYASSGTNKPVWSMVAMAVAMLLPLLGVTLF